MQIFGPFRVSAAQPPAGAERMGAAKANQPTSPARGGSPIDELDLSSSVSGHNRISEAASSGGSGEIRVDRVAELRRQIADGSYDTPERLDAALDRLLDRLG